MQDLRQSLAFTRRDVNPDTQSELQAAIREYAMLTTGVAQWGSRASYFRRLQLLALGWPRAMNFARDWCCALHQLSELPPTGTLHRQRIRAAWRRMAMAAEAVVAQISLQIREVQKRN